MAINISRPDVLAKPFAADGEKNTIPVAATGTNRASLTEGFPPITGRSVENDDGIPPEKNDFNGLGYLLSLFCFALQNGWLPTFEADVSTAIGGYPLGAMLWYAAGNYFVKSLKANNTDNFVSDPTKIDGVSWQRVTLTQADITSAVAAKADTDLNNTSANLDYIVESGTDSVTGISYRLWRSGLLEQFYNGQNTGDIVTFPRAYAARPNIQATAVLTGGGNDTVLTITSASATGFSSVGRNTGGSGIGFTFDWYAQGWAAAEN